MGIKRVRLQTYFGDRLIKDELTDQEVYVMKPIKLYNLRRCPKCRTDGGLVYCPTCHTRDKSYPLSVKMHTIARIIPQMSTTEVQRLAALIELEWVPEAERLEDMDLT